MFAARTFALVALLATGAYAAECTRQYTVKEGDYCDKISAANKASTYQLGAINAGVINEACDNLVPGQSICLGTANEDCTSTYVVARGNTCEQIWDTAKINATIFSFNNPQVNEDCTNIYIGEVLCVANEVLVPEAPNVPFHTAPPATATPTFANGATGTPTKTPVPTSVAPQVQPTTAPAHLDEEEEECEDIEVVVGGDEDLPFCDELE